MADSRQAVEGEVLRPGEEPSRLPSGSPHDRFGAAGGLFRDQNLDTLSRVLDTWFRVPGTNIRFGLDGIIGFIPGLGDAAGGLASCIIILAAYFRGAPLVTLARMVANVAIEVVVGAVPVLGNLFDIGWRANRRNFHLLERTLLTGRRDRWRDWVFMAVIGVALLTLAMLPFLALTWMLRKIFGADVHWL
jgi:hypothetical protein